MIRKHPISCETETMEGKKKNKRKKKDVRTIHDDGGISVNTLCLSIDRDTLRAQYKQRKRDKNHSLPIFAIGVRAYSSLSLRLVILGKERKRKKKKKIIRRTGKCLMVFGSIHVRPTRERNLESVSSGPVGKTSLHISYVGVHSCASILTSSLSTRFLHSSMLATV